MYTHITSTICTTPLNGVIADKLYCQSTQVICGTEGLVTLVLADPMHAQLINEVVDSALC